MNRKIFIDIETTGLDFVKDKIIKIEMMKYDENFNYEDSYEQYINPEMVIPDNIIKINGITNEFLKDKPIFSDIKDSFLDFIEDKNYIIGFALKDFVLKFILNEFISTKKMINFTQYYYFDLKKYFTYEYKPTSLNFVHSFVTNKFKFDNDYEVNDKIEKIVKVFKNFNLDNNKILNEKYNKYFSKYIDVSEKISVKNNDFYLEFGKYKNVKLSFVIEKDIDYLKYIMQNNYVEPDTKFILKKLLKKFSS